MPCSILTSLQLLSWCYRTITFRGGSWIIIVSWCIPNSLDYCFLHISKSTCKCRNDFTNRRRIITFLWLFKACKSNLVLLISRQFTIFFSRIFFLGIKSYSFTLERGSLVSFICIRNTLTSSSSSSSSSYTSTSTTSSSSLATSPSLIIRYLL